MWKLWQTAFMQVLIFSKMEEGDKVLFSKRWKWLCSGYIENLKINSTVLERKLNEKHFYHAHLIIRMLFLMVFYTNRLTIAISIFLEGITEQSLKHSSGCRLKFSQNPSIYRRFKYVVNRLFNLLIYLPRVGRWRSRNHSWSVCPSAPQITILSSLPNCFGASYIDLLVL